MKYYQIYLDNKLYLLEDFRFIFLPIHNSHISTISNSSRTLGEALKPLRASAKHPKLNHIIIKQSKESSHFSSHLISSKTKKESPHSVPAKRPTPRGALSKNLPSEEPVSSHVTPQSRYRFNLSNVKPHQRATLAFAVAKLQRFHAFHVFRSSFSPWPSPPPCMARRGMGERGPAKTQRNGGPAVH